MTNGQLVFFLLRVFACQFPVTTCVTSTVTEIMPFLQATGPSLVPRHSEGGWYTSPYEFTGLTRKYMSGKTSNYPKGRKDAWVLVRLTLSFVACNTSHRECSHPHCSLALSLFHSASLSSDLPSAISPSALHLGISWSRPALSHIRSYQCPPWHQEGKRGITSEYWKITRDLLHQSEGLY
ncbi:hypothetical protein DFH29DRAFT_188313 [Suillus ampliporus]|nr:hypothetical protein DFH29DRAFT_188313 [Suillus ampliporus]